MFFATIYFGGPAIAGTPQASLNVKGHCMGCTILFIFKCLSDVEKTKINRFVCEHGVIACGQPPNSRD